MGAKPSLNGSCCSDCCNLFIPHTVLDQRELSRAGRSLRRLSGDRGVVIRGTQRKAVGVEHRVHRGQKFGHLREFGFVPRTLRSHGRASSQGESVGVCKDVSGFYMEDGLEEIELELRVQGGSWGRRGAFAPGWDCGEWRRSGWQGWMPRRPGEPALGLGGRRGVGREKFKMRPSG